MKYPPEARGVGARTGEEVALVGMLTAVTASRCIIEVVWWTGLAPWEFESQRAPQAQSRERRVLYEKLFNSKKNWQ